VMWLALTWAERLGLGHSGHHSFPALVIAGIEGKRDTHVLIHLVSD
jgi:hypothetical protein